MKPVSDMAFWYWPVEDTDILYQYVEPDVVRSVHVTPKSEEVQILLL